MKPRQRLLMAATFVLVIVMTACTSPSTATQAPGTSPATEAATGTEAGTEAATSTEAAGGATSASPNTVRIGWAGSPDKLNPGTGILSESYTIYELVYDSLYQEEPDGTYTLDAAESANTSPDGKTWTFKIRQGMTFHDGQPLTAKDVAFTLNLNKKHEDFPYLHAYTTHFESVEATDDSTVVIKLDDPIPNMESQLIYQYILPEHIWGKLDDKQTVDFENTDMIGSGPFQMAEYKQNEFVHLKAFANNHRWHPKVTDVVFQTFENQDALVQAIKTGQVDMITEMPSTAIPGLKNADNVKIVSGPPMSPYVSDIIFDQIDPKNCPKDSKCTGNPALRDKNVRMALAYATDKNQIIQVVKLGFATPGLTLIPDGLAQFYNTDLKDYGYDPAQANKILDDAGYKDVDGDGIRETPDGKKSLTLRMNWPSDSTTGPRMAELLHDMWKQVGVDTQLQAVDPDALTAACCPAYDFDVILWGWGSDPDPSALLDVMTTAEIPTGSSETGYSNPTYDDLYQKQSIELDKDKRIQMVKQMQQIVHDDVVYIIPFYEQAVQAYRTDRFKGWLTQGRIALEDVSSLAVVEPAN